MRINTESLSKDRLRRGLMILKMSHKHGFSCGSIDEEDEGYLLYNAADSLVAFVLYNKGAKGVWISRMFVHPKYRRRGLGRYLCHLCENSVKPGQKVRLTPLPDALGFWTKMGYNETHNRWFYEKAH